MDQEVCTIFLGNGILDDDYTIYESGKMLRVYDRNAFKLNQEQWLEAKTLDESIKQKLIDKCPDEKKPKLKHLFYPG